MVTTVLGRDVAQQARSGNYIGIPYERLDCQAFLERVLEDLQVRKPDGSKYNWKGSNSMFRHYISWRGTIDECEKQFGTVPEGAFLFRVVDDDGEIPLGYSDGLGNARHVGMYVGDDLAMDSNRYRGNPGRNGVDYVKDWRKKFDHVGLMSMIVYDDLPQAKITRAEALEALNILTKYLKEATL